MPKKHRAMFTLAALCVAGIPFAFADANTFASVPLVTTKAPAVHALSMQDYMGPPKVDAAGPASVMMTPLMPTKDRLAHQASNMQVFPWVQPDGLGRPADQSSTNVEAPLMPTKDLPVHERQQQNPV